jgi:hypothetical protein
MTEGREASLAEPQLELIELNAQRDYRVSKDQPDPRGWLVRTQDHQEVGRVVDLIIDRQVMAARYLVCELAGQRRVLIPTGFARVESETETVHVDFITADALARMPPFAGLPLSPEQQLAIETALTLREPAPPDPIIQRRQESS